MRRVRSKWLHGVRQKKEKLRITLRFHELRKLIWRNFHRFWKTNTDTIPVRSQISQPMSPTWSCWDVLTGISIREISWVYAITLPITKPGKHPMEVREIPGIVWHTTVFRHILCPMQTLVIRCRTLWTRLLPNWTAVSLPTFPINCCLHTVTWRMNAVRTPAPSLSLILWPDITKTVIRY